MIASPFELGDEQDGAVAFSYSPLLESVQSLHVLAEPKHHALQHDLVRRMRALPASLRREISALSFLYRWTLPDCVLPAADTGYEGFDVELARLRRLRTDVVAFDLLRPIYDHGGRPRPGRRRILTSPEVRTGAVRSAATLGAQEGRAATMLFDDPAAFVERFAALLEAYCVNCDPPWPLAVVYRAPYLTDRRRPTPPQLVQLLKALADPTRLRILELVGERPRSTQELAPSSV
jgi:hypothetical protein